MDSKSWAAWRSLALVWGLAPDPAAGGGIKTRTRSDGVVVIYTDDSVIEHRGRPSIASEELGEIIDRIARLENLDPQLVRAVIEVESSSDNPPCCGV